MKISIKSVLYNISNLIPEEEFNEDIFLEWGYSALRLINSKNSFTQEVIELPIIEHVVSLPPHKSINQVRVKQEKAVQNYDLYNNIVDYSYETEWTVAIETNESFFSPNPCNSEKMCIYKYKIYDNTLKINSKDGLVQVDYNKYAEEIEDNEYVKKAIEDYILYKLSQKRSLINEKYIEIAQLYYQNFIISSAQARGNDNSPKLSELENIRSNYTNLLPRDRFKELFTTSTTKLNHL